MRELEGLPHPLLVQHARAAVDDARARVMRGERVTRAEVVTEAHSRVDRQRERRLLPVVNATGVLLHTNLGRAPLGDHTIAAIGAVARGYSNLEYRLDTGQRGSRHEHAGAAIAAACGAEAGLVVNNNAAAVLLTLSALARDREVVVSRGELVEIGGGFRVPEVMAQSGCRLVEVGSTNRTRPVDYAGAIGPGTALLLKVHASNYRMVGFTRSVSVRELTALGRPVVFDSGSGLLDETTPWLAHRPSWLQGEPGVRQALDDGADLVTFSGDKLLGGPQAGLLVGRRSVVDTVARHPLARAVRADKLTLAGLQTVADAYLSGTAAELPLWQMATAPLNGLVTRAETITRAVPHAKVVDTEAVAGGGSLPGATIPSAGVALELQGHGGRAVADALAALRAAGVVARAVDGRLTCDLRSVDPADDARLTEALRALVP